jgi:hypothetical protein
VGGGHFLIKKTHYGIEPRVPFLTLLRATGTIGAGAALSLNTVSLLVRLGTDALDHATLGIFFRFQIPDSDLFFGFFSLCHFIFPSYLFCCSGGNNRLSYLLKCGGRSFFDQENRMTDMCRAMGIEPSCGSSC